VRPENWNLAKVESAASTKPISRQTKRYWRRAVTATAESDA
jgi:hypothetical protein